MNLYIYIYIYIFVSSDLNDIMVAMMFSRLSIFLPMNYDYLCL